MCLAPEDEASLTPDERIHEIAAILAEGVRRARHGATSPPENDALLPKSTAVFSPRIGQSLSLLIVKKKA